MQPGAPRASSRAFAIFSIAGQRPSATLQHGVACYATGALVLTTPVLYCCHAAHPPMTNFVCVRRAQGPYAPLTRARYYVISVMGLLIRHLSRCVRCRPTFLSELASTKHEILCAIFHQDSLYEIPSVRSFDKTRDSLYGVTASQHTSFDSKDLLLEQLYMRTESASSLLQTEQIPFFRIQTIQVDEVSEEWTPTSFR